MPEGKYSRRAPPFDLVKQKRALLVRRRERLNQEKKNQVIDKTKPLTRARFFFGQVNGRDIIILRTSLLKN